MATSSPPSLSLPRYPQALVAGGILAAAINVSVPLFAPDRHVKSLKSAFGFFATILVVNQYIDPTLVAYMVNPWGVNTTTWASIYLLKCLGLALMDVVVLGLIRVAAVPKLK